PQQLQPQQQQPLNDRLITCLEQFMNVMGKIDEDMKQIGENMKQI
ncbi:unnamed protein product, partial [Rotaria sordida]